MKYCTNCSTENSKKARFCSNCGQTFSYNAINNSTENKVLVLKPAFKSALFFIRVIPVLIFFSWMPLYVLGFFFIPIIELFELGELAANLLLLLLGIVYYGVLISFFHGMTKRNYAQTSYTFLEDRLVYYDGFFNREQKEIKYQAIVEIGYSESVIQRWYGLGSINLSTSATAASKSQPSGIVVLDIEDTEVNFLKFKAIYDGNA